MAHAECGVITSLRHRSDEQEEEKADDNKSLAILSLEESQDLLEKAIQDGSYY